MIGGNMIFVTTTLYSKWLDYQQEIIKKLFPESEIITVDGRGNWPNSWFYWIDEVKKSDKKYYIHLDEDFFLTSKSELLKAIEKLESDDCDLLGCPDGYHHYRGANSVALNTFLMIGRVDDVKRLNTDLKSAKYQYGIYDGINYSWFNSLDIKFKPEYKNDFNYKFKEQGGSNFEQEQEPYYAFLWSMKELGCKFDYLYPHFDERFKSTNPRLDENSDDIGIHMWYTRQWNSTMDVWGLPNIERYNLVEKFIQSEIIFSE
jgi:hypothetical protein